MRMRPYFPFSQSLLIHLGLALALWQMSRDFTPETNIITLIPSLSAPMPAKNESSDQIPKAAAKPVKPQPSVAPAAPSQSAIHKAFAETGTQSTQATENAFTGTEAQKYLAALYEKIEKNKFYPSLAKQMRQSGGVEISVVIAKDGSLVSSQIVKPSPYPKLNEAALQTVQKSFPINAFPAGITENFWTVNVPLKYSL